MGIDDRPLPKPSVVKFAAVVTTAAFAGYHVCHSARDLVSLTALRHTAIFDDLQRQQRRARFQLGIPLVLLRCTPAAVHTQRRFIEKRMKCWLHFGGYLLQNRARESRHPYTCNPISQLLVIDSTERAAHWPSSLGFARCGVRRSPSAWIQAVNVYRCASAKVCRQQKAHAICELGWVL